ncbi:hypothetical protein GSI_05819 [Ganoderma sinense ZZ0214-1]|uniref:Uncharacterized protein n=1 Tax=Ganoderma sinense ZZ0214-1 TaxID=1077348 RepID=A0A2G8SBK8_9APHY|nr:hypothetical protein GSI_05819 [Ganoderma sinense ZZ0214-1]
MTTVYNPGADSHERSVDAHEEPHLNFDVLHLICNYLTDIPDVLSFALTCSALTEDALRRRLKMAPVDLSDAEMINSFHAFIFSNEPSRAPFIYGLRLKLPSPCGLQATGNSDFRIIANRLVAILKAAVHIQHLGFNTSICNSVFDAMVRLTTVRELHIFNDVLMYQGLLLNRLAIFQSPLRSLCIAGSEHVGTAVSASFLHDRLSHLAPTLEFLDLDDFPIDVLPSSVTTQFTAVRSLKLQAYFPPNCDLLGVLLQFFPNLDNTLDLGSLNAYMTQGDVPAFRERCEEAQRRHSWSGLDQLVCDADTAYLIALQCPIRRMSTRITWSVGWECLAGALRHNSPRQLRVAVHFDAGFRGLDNPFPPEAVDKLTHLVMSADIEVRYRCGAGRKANNRHWDRFIDRLVRSIQHLRLTHLRIIFRASVHHSARMPPRRDELFQTACGVDLRSAAARFVNAMPSLRYLFLTACGHTYVVPAPKARLLFERRTLDSWFSSAAWQLDVACDNATHKSDSGVSDASLSSSCVKLSRDAMERIMDREELRLSRYEESVPVDPSADDYPSHLLYTFVFVHGVVSHGASMTLRWLVLYPGSLCRLPFSRPLPQTADDCESCGGKHKLTETLEDTGLSRAVYSTKHEDLDLSNAEIINSFHAFIFSNEPSRAPCIYGLKIPSPYYDLEDIDRSCFRYVNGHLVDILEAAVHVKYLKFATSISTLVFNAVSRLTMVRELRILADAPQSPLRSRLPTFRSPLRSLHLVGSQLVADTISARFLHDRLSHLAPTLELLDLDCFPVDIFPSSVTTQFTAVRSLKVKTSFVSSDFHPLDVLLCLFPRLDNTLTLGPLSMSLRGDAFYPEFRERSKDAQKRHAWSGLDQLACDAETAYLITLQCPIRCMDIEVGWSGAAPYLVETLRHQSPGPQQLYVHLSLYDGFGALNGLFPPEAADRLTHLTVFADIGIPQGLRSCRRMGDNAPAPRFAMKMISSISHLRLTHLRIVFRFTVLYQSMRKASVHDADPADIRGAGGRIDLDRTAARFVDAMPSLQYVFLTTCGEARPILSRRSLPSSVPPKTPHKWGSSKAWRVAYDGENIRHDLEPTEVRRGACVELSVEAAERIAGEEGLELSRHEEDGFAMQSGAARLEHDKLEPRLNFDVLRLLCSYLSDVPDVLSFALTCSTLTELSFRRRLRMAPVNLRDAKSVDRFHAFIFSNQTSRAPSIYGLRLPGQRVYNSSVVDKCRLDKHILALLKAAVHIQYLDVPIPTRVLLLDAMVNLTTVRELKVDSNDSQAPLCIRITASRSPLRSLCIRGGSHFVNDAISASFLHNHLSHFAPTLEVLQLDYFPITLRPVKITTPFLAVRSLKLKNISGFSSECLAVLLRLFPKLDNELEIDLWNSRRAEEVDFPGIQEQNKKAQNTHGTWSGLDHLVCDPETALLLALRCPIRRMSTTITWPRSQRKYLAGALRHNSPRQLYVALQLITGFRGLDGLFPPEASGTLTRLVLCAHLGVHYRRGALKKANNVHWDRFIERLVRSIQHLRLTHLRIVFSSSVNYSSRTLPPDEELFQAAWGVDLLPAASRLVRAVPSLQYIFLTAYGHTYVVPPKARCSAFQQRTLDSWLSSGAWQVVHFKEASHPGGLSDASGSSECIELSREAAKWVADQEELQLSREEEVGDFSLSEIAKLT